MKISVLEKKRDQQTTVLSGFTQILMLPTLGFGVQSSNSAFKANVLVSPFTT